MLRACAIHEIREAGVKFVCGIFVIPKANGGFRQVINSKPVNSFIRRMHFKMENLALLQRLLGKGDYFAKVEFTDAYSLVPLRKEDSRQFVQFQ